MATNYIQDGDTITVAAAPYAVDAGEVVKKGMIVGIAVNDAAEGAEVVVKRTGVWYATKVSAQAWAQGQGVYWNDGLQAFTTTGTGGVFVGFAARAADNPSANGYVCLTGSVTANQTDGSS